MRSSRKQVAALILAAATLVDVYVLFEQREGGQPHPVPDPASDRFPVDATVFADNPKGAWACRYSAAFNNMMAERKKDRTKYWCERRKAQTRSP